MQTYKKIAFYLAQPLVAIGIAVLVIAGAVVFSDRAHAANTSFGMQNFWYAPNLQLTPLPGFNTIVLPGARSLYIGTTTADTNNDPFIVVDEGSQALVALNGASTGGQISISSTPGSPFHDGSGIMLGIDTTSNLTSGGMWTLADLGGNNFGISGVVNDVVTGGTGYSRVFVGTSAAVASSTLNSAFSIYPDATSGAYNFVVRDRANTKNLLSIDDNGRYTFPDGSTMITATAPGTGIASMNDLNFQTAGVMNFGLSQDSGVSTSTFMKLTNQGYLEIQQPGNPLPTTITGDGSASSIPYGISITSGGGIIFNDATNVTQWSYIDSTAANTLEIGDPAGSAVLDLSKLTTARMMTLPDWSGDFLVGSTTSLYQTAGGNIGVGTSTPASLLTVDSGSAATTTVDFGDQYSSSAHACFNTKNTAGGNVSFYFVGTSMVVEGNLCK